VCSTSLTSVLGVITVISKHHIDSCAQAFKTLKGRLMDAPLLAHYDIDNQCLLETDASDTVVAAVFSQKGLDEEWHPVALSG
jgi:RNase H-like domain found in reverse transcriptase